MRREIGGGRAWTKLRTGGRSSRERWRSAPARCVSVSWHSPAWSGEGVIRLTAGDGHELDAYLARPAGARSRRRRGRAGNVRRERLPALGLRLLRGARLCGDRAGAVRPQAARIDLPLHQSRVTTSAQTDLHQMEISITRWPISTPRMRPLQTPARSASSASAGAARSPGSAPAGGTTPARSPITAR